MIRNFANRNPSDRSLLPFPTLLSAVALACGLLLVGVASAQPARGRPGHVVQQRPVQQRPAQQRPTQPRPVAASRPTAQSERTPAPIVRVNPGVPQSTPAPSVAQRPAPSTNNAAVRGVPLVVPNRPGQTQQHLAGWMQQHSNMALPEQQRALDAEPGVRGLPAQEQQQLHNRLRQLNSMSPTDRKQTIAHIESWENLRPRDRQAVSAAMNQLGSLPEDRQHAVSRGFHSAMAMPESQRQAWLNSPQARGQFNENERNTLNNLLIVQPAAAQAGFGWAKPPAPHE